MSDDPLSETPGAAPEPESARSLELAAFEQRLGHRFADRAHLELALVHRSFANERRLPAHNERLEFVGDSVLGMVTADWLFRRYPERAEGELARAKAALVSEGPLSRFAESLELGGLLRLGVGEARSGGSRKTSLLGDALEAVWAAIWLDGGFEPARAAIERYLDWAIGLVEVARTDFKTRLQEWVQARGGELPIYAIVEESGPEHERTFVCEVSVRGEVVGRGYGASKKEAHQQAAAAALDRLVPAVAEVGAEPAASASAEDSPRTG